MTVSRKRKSRHITMHVVAKETSSGPVSAQVHLRDIATPLRPPTESGRNAGGNESRLQSVTGEALLEFQDLTDSHR